MFREILTFWFDEIEPKKWWGGLGRKGAWPK